MVALVVFGSNGAPGHRKLLAVDADQRYTFPDLAPPQPRLAPKKP